MIKIIKGDLIQLAKSGKFNIIAHGCNCFCVMGKGLAAEIKKEFPEAYAVDAKTSPGDISKLGTYTKAVVGPLIILNCYTQYNYGRSGMYTDLSAVDSCMRKIADEFPGAKIGMPKIGSGLGGGNWDEIFSIINDCLGHLDVTIVEYCE